MQINLEAWNLPNYLGKCVRCHHYPLFAINAGSPPIPLFSISSVNPHPTTLVGVRGAATQYRSSYFFLKWSQNPRRIAAQILIWHPLQNFSQKNWSEQVRSRSHDVTRETSSGHRFHRNRRPSNLLALTEMQTMCGLDQKMATSDLSTLHPGLPRPS